MSSYPDLVGKNVLITGASGDIGLALCAKYLQLSCQVYALYHHDISGLQHLKETHPHGAKLHIEQCNVADKKSLETLEQKLAAQIDSLHVLVNNAGINKDNLFTTMTDEEFDQVIQVGLYGTYYTSKVFLRLLRHAHGAAIVNVSSVSGITSSFGQANYSTAKAGVNGLTRTIASELAAKGIRVNAVAPGMIESRMVKKVPRRIVQNILTAIPLKRLGHVDEIANVVAFLSSESSSYIVGQTIVADGGLVMR